jgi:hypothetical protein
LKKKMRNIIKFSFLVFGLLWATACDEGFDEMNVNSTAATNINPVFMLNNASISASHPNAVLTYDMGIVQQLVSPNSGVLTGANFNQDNRDVTQQIWQRHYRVVIRNLVDVINATKSQAPRSNLYNMARILKAYSFMILTDTYGDVPYSEAGIGYISQVLSPKYDTQQSIYSDLIKELTEAGAALDASKAIETADVLYGGNVAQWKKFANSLLLRAGMRLSKIDQSLAQATVQKAIAGGVITTNADNAVIRHDANYVNELGRILNATEASNFYLGAPFVDYLKANDDPRLSSIAVRYVGAASGPEQVASRANKDAASQVGMPFGFDNNTISGPVKDKGLKSFYDFSQIDRTRMSKVASPTFIVTASQSSLLIAEAIQRGWSTGSAETQFKNGVKAHLEQVGTWDAGSVIPNATQDAFIAKIKLDAGKELEQINTQYWVASFLNGPEAFANFRRSGFPKLTPNPFPGKATKGEFIRRHTYPNSEISVNGDKVKEAIARQGADDLDTRVWWDK